MTKFEIIILICAFVVPIIALFVVKPKFKLKKKEKAKKQKAKQIKEEQVQVETETKKVEPVLNSVKETEKIEPFESFNYSVEDFKDYAQKKQEKLSKPKLKFAEKTNTFSFDEFLKSKEEKRIQNKTQNFEDLSPELKAMLIAGVFNKKY